MYFFCGGVAGVVSNNKYKYIKKWFDYQLEKESN